MNHLAKSLASFALLPALAFAQDVEEAPPPPQQEEPAPAPSKASLAVIPFTYNAEIVHRHRNGQMHVDIEPFETSTFTNKFITALVKTRKFDIVERQRVDRLLDEMQMSESGIMDPARAVEAGRMVGADYVLTGEISVFNIQIEWSQIPNTSRLSRKVTALIIVDMRIIDSRTSRVVSADKGEVRHEERTMHQQRVPFSLEPDFIDKSQRELADQLTQATIDGVYPVKIVSNSDGVIVLNRGEGGGLQVGTVLDVYLTGDEMVDPDTGDSLGFEEVKVGKIQVTEILARFSKAQLVEARAPLPKGAICRRSKEPSSRPAEPPRRGPRW